VSLVFDEAAGLGWDDKPGLGFGRTSWRAVCKRAFDIVVAGIGLGVLALVVVAIAPLVWLTDGGPVFYLHTRIGRGGVPFRCLKLRTMILDAEAALERHMAESPAARAEWAATRKLQADPRVLGWVGRFLRRMSIDELPQVWNVLRGEMSIVGPRPIIEAELSHYGVHSTWYLSVRPGLTGPWQVNGRSDTSYATRVWLDVQYARRASLRRDFGICLRTFGAVLVGRGAC
jgi:lipopolysaccharide/colanic/teichoic acid biosynthesis glycosyltransferase